MAQFQGEKRQARADLDKKESEREKALTDLQKKLDDNVQHQYQERAKELDGAVQEARELVEEEAKALADANAEALTAAEMAEAVKAENDGKASIPAPRAHGDTMPSEVAAELGESEDDEEDEDDLDEDASDLLDAGQIERLSERLLEIVSTRPNELTDAIEDPQVQAAVENLVAACSDDFYIAFGVMSVRFAHGL